jgi:hypothetical protein
MRYSDYKSFRIAFDCGIVFASIDHPPINLLDEVLSQEFENSEQINRARTRACSASSRKPEPTGFLGAVGSALG